MSLLVVGSIAIDTIETPFGVTENAIGGSATYISTTASYFYKPIRLVGVVGGDFPIEGIKFLEERSIDLKGLQIEKKGKTFRWGGRYHCDMNRRDTLFTELNVFEHFNPHIPDIYLDSSYVCLGNIEPLLQYNVVEQLKNPRLVVGDTMNFWIERRKAKLLETLKKIDILIINESETRLLAEELNLVKAARSIIRMGPKIVIIKKGEHGAVMISERAIFSAPAYPLENVCDPTGAGDAFAGGFIGWIAKTENLSEDNLRRAIIYGTVMASFCVENFSLDRFKGLSHLEIQNRFKEIKGITHYDDELFEISA